MSSPSSKHLLPTGCSWLVCACWLARLYLLGRTCAGTTTCSAPSFYSSTPTRPHSTWYSEQHLFCMIPVNFVLVYHPDCSQTCFQPMPNQCQIIAKSFRILAGWAAGWAESASDGRQFFERGGEQATKLPFTSYRSVSIEDLFRPWQRKHHAFGNNHEMRDISSSSKWFLLFHVPGAGRFLPNVWACCT